MSEILSSIELGLYSVLSLETLLRVGLVQLSVWSVAKVPVYCSALQLLLDFVAVQLAMNQLWVHLLPNFELALRKATLQRQGFQLHLQMLVLQY
jgi:hypothetical protein